MLLPWSWVLPESCLGCGALLHAARVPALCRGCGRSVAALPPERRVEHGIEACYPYEGPLAAALWRLKFRGRIDLAGPLGAALREAEAWREDWDAVVPVPLHWRRTLVRGYNQAALLARSARVGRPSAPPVRPRWLSRRRAGVPARALSAADRAREVLDAFVVPDPRRVHGRRVLLLDDVTTTGATLGAAAQALQRAGAARIGALALMRTLG